MASKKPLEKPSGKTEDWKKKIKQELWSYINKDSLGYLSSLISSGKKEIDKLLDLAISKTEQAILLKHLDKGDNDRIRQEERKAFADWLKREIFNHVKFHECCISKQFIKAKLKELRGK